MSPLRGPAPRTFAQTVDVFECLARHLPMPLARVGGLVLRYSPQETLPDIAQQTGDVQADARQRDRERWEELGCVPGGVEGRPSLNCRESRDGQSREERSSNGSHDVGWRQ